MSKKRITVDFTRRLPDLKEKSLVPPDLYSYGSCGVLPGKCHWFSTFPKEKPRGYIGFFWGIDFSKNIMYISPQNSEADLRVITKDLIYFILKENKIEQYVQKYITE